jgi:hypothetical protein
MGLSTPIAPIEESLSMGPVAFSPSCNHFTAPYVMRVRASSFPERPGAHPGAPFLP